MPANPATFCSAVTKKPERTTIWAALVMAILCTPYGVLLAQSTVGDAVLLSFRLTNAAGLPIQGDTSVVVRGYTSPALAAVPMYEETFEVNVIEGQLSLPLGAKAPFPTEMLLTAPLWLGVSVEGDTEMQPRIEVGAVPVAWKSVDADTVGGFAATDFALAGQECPAGEVARATDSKGLLVCSPLASVAYSGQHADLQNILPPVQLGTAPAAAGEPGELFFNTSKAALLVWTGDEWTSVTAADGLSLPYSGSATTTSHGFRVTQLDTGAALVGRSFSSSSGEGVRGEVAGNAAIAIRGHSALTTGYAGYFTGGRSYFEGPIGVGVPSPAASLHVQSNGNATALFTNTGTAQGNTAVEAEIQSAAGRAVFAWASNPNGDAVGVWGRSDSGAGVGVKGQSTTTQGLIETAGVEGTAVGAASTGVRGFGPPTGFGSGVKGQSNSPNGRGVVALNTSTSGSTFGLHATANSPSGTGVYAEGGTGVYAKGSVGVHGQSNNSYGAAVRAVACGGSVSNPFNVTAGIGFHQTKDPSCGDSWTPNGPNPSLVTNHFEGNLVVAHPTPTAYFALYVGSDSAVKVGGGLWGSASDVRLKRNVRPLVGALARLLTLEGITFEYTDDALATRGGARGEQIGFIAQKVREVFPDWVGEDAGGYLYVAEKGVVALFVEALRELREEGRAAIDRLEADNRVLAQDNRALREDLRALQKQNEAMLRRLETMESRLHSLPAP